MCIIGAAAYTEGRANAEFQIIPTTTIITARSRAPDETAAAEGSIRKIIVRPGGTHRIRNLLRLYRIVARSPHGVPRALESDGFDA